MCVCVNGEIDGYREDCEIEFQIEVVIHGFCIMFILVNIHF